MKRILLVDDDSAIREIFSIFLERSGYSVQTAPGGEECLSILQTTRPDLVVLDIMMQPMDGWETLSSIRNNPEMKDMPVIMFSGKSPIQEEIDRYGGWIEDYLLKPMKFAEIDGTLAAMFDRHAGLQRKQDMLSKTGADPRMIGECCSLTRSLFIRKKFSPICHGDMDQCVRDIERIEERIRQLNRSMNVPEKGAPPAQTGEMVL